MHTLPTTISLSLLLLLTTTTTTTTVSAAWVFTVRNKFAGHKRSLDLLKAHDTRRHLADIDLPLGGNGRPNSAGLYYAKIGIGTPPEDFYVQVDTGSDIMWVTCVRCRGCPDKNYLGIDLALYNLKDSLTGSLVSCDEMFCRQINDGFLSGCTNNQSCPYFEFYGDGSSTAGYFVSDIVQYDRISGNLQTSLANESVIFGCGSIQSGDMGSAEEALDGILGFGQSNSSMISQLAAAGKAKKMFAHCLDGINGGGIFAIGHVVQPKVNTTPLVQNQSHYNVNMMGVQVGRAFLNLSTDMFGAGGGKLLTVIDSGTTLAYLPQIVYEPLVSKIFSNQSDLKVHTVHDQYTCFEYSGSVDDVFPSVTFHFENNVSLKVYPHEYLFLFEELWCLGWQNRGSQSRDKNVTLLGDLVLSNKLVVYDLENQVIGWTEYNCSSSIKVQDERTGTVHLVGPHYLPADSSAYSLNSQMFLILFLLATLLHINKVTAFL